MEIALFTNLIHDYTLRTVVMGSAVIGITAGALGVFALLRGQSLLGDAISHASLPGIAIAFLLTATKNPAILLFGGAVAGTIGSVCILGIIRYTKIKSDAALGIILSVFFGIGLVLLTYIQKHGSSNQSILNKFLFGSASTLLQEDVFLMLGVGGVVLGLLVLFWKECTLLAFDPAYLRVLGYRVVWLDGLLTMLMVLSIVVGLQTVGVVLMSSLLVAPAAAARQWTKQLSHMVILAACFGAGAGVIGSLISSCVTHLPTGPTIVVVISVIVLISLLFGTRRGFA
jgi:manganese/zinc/iron transport system permease protein